MARHQGNRRPMPAAVSKGTRISTMAGLAGLAWAHGQGRRPPSRCAWGPFFTRAGSRVRCAGEGVQAKRARLIVSKRLSVRAKPLRGRARAAEPQYSAVRPTSRVEDVASAPRHAALAARTLPQSGAFHA
jgi:hypothetical protein